MSTGLARPAVTYDDYETLSFERRENKVLVVTLDRPESLNSITYLMHTELARVWEEIGRDDETNIVVVTGAGRAFSAGGDLKQDDPTPAQIIQQMDEAARIVWGIIDLDKPVVSAVTGAAVGPALAVALLSDISIVAEDATLLDGHTLIGLTAGDHACLVWPLTAGLAKGKYYVLTNERLSGKEAERIGLVSMTLPAEQVLETAYEVADKLARGSQQALRWTKRSLNQWYRQASPIFEQSLALDILGFFGKDVIEGRAAFHERREPNFPSAGLPAQTTAGDG
jgi:enoyl-CoA hydratase